MPRILLSSGRGPIECELAVGLYLRFLLAHCPTANVVRKNQTKSIETNGKRLTGYNSVLLDVPAGDATRTGTVLWVCQSPARPAHRRKNWFIKVSLIPEDADPDRLDDTDIDWTAPDKRRFKIETFRCPGKGGQNVNKVETGVRITYLPTGDTAESVTARTQLANRKLALERLREKMTAKNVERERQTQKDEWSNHTRIERGNAFASFEGLDFIPAR